MNSDRNYEGPTQAEPTSSGEDQSELVSDYYESESWQFSSCGD
jgi:hypothetical protein